METPVDHADEWMHAPPGTRGCPRGAVTAPAPPRYEYTTLASENTMTMGEDMTEMGRIGWRYVGSFVRYETVHIVFEREVS